MVLKMQNRTYWNKYWSKNTGIVKFINFLKERYFLNIIHRYLKNFKQSTKILEVGCGNGKLLEKFPRNKVIGIDFSPIAIKRAKMKIKDFPLIMGDAFKLNFCNNSFDLVYSNGLIEHYIDSFEEIIREKYRITKKGGYVITIISKNMHVRDLLFRYIYYWDRYKIQNIKNYNILFKGFLPKISNKFKLETIPKSFGLLMAIVIKKC